MASKLRAKDLGTYQSRASTSSYSGSSGFKRDSLDAFTISVEALDTNTTFASRYCAELNSTHDTVNINNPHSIAIVIPYCTSENTVDSLVSLTANHMIIDNFASLPSSLNHLQCLTCTIMPSADFATPTTATPSSAPSAVTYIGFDASTGTIEWSSALAHLSNLKELRLPLATAISPTLPPKLGPKLISFDMHSSGLSGPIPSTFFEDVATVSEDSDLVIDVSYNQLSGDLPPALLSYFSTTSVLLKLNFNFNGNGVTGPYPETFFHGLTTHTSELMWQGYNNHMNGSIPANLFPPDLITDSFHFDGSGNFFSDSIPANLFINLPIGIQFVFIMSNNLLSGPLPANLFGIGWFPDGTFYLHLDHNELSGSIPPGLLSSSLTSNFTIDAFILDLNHNYLNGTIPESLLFRYLTQVKRESDSSSASYDEGTPVGIFAGSLFRLDLGFNNLSGVIPPKLLSMSYDTDGTFNLGNVVTLSGNQLSGPIPSELWDTVPATTALFVLEVDDNAFTGPLPSACPAARWRFYAHNNSIDGTIPTSWSDCRLEMVRLNNNPELGGSIPANFSNSGIQSFDASYTSLSGVIPILPSSLTLLKLGHTNIDFCNPQSISQMEGFTNICEVDFTSACECPAAYTCQPSIPCSAVPSEPMSPSRFNPPSSTCRLETRPGPNFQCLSGQWRSVGAFDPTVFIVPSGAGSVIITEDTTMRSIILKDIGSQVTFESCAANLSSVKVELSKEQVESFGKQTLTQPLITAQNTSCTNLNRIALSSTATSGCKKINSRPSVSSDGRTLSAIFTINSSSCNRWWIILVSVICALVLLTVIILIVIFVMVPKLKLKARPYAGSEGHTPF